MTDENSQTPAIDKVMEAQYGDVDAPDLPESDYSAAALEAYDLLGQVLSETGSMYLLLGAMLGRDFQGTEDDVSA